jgi:hypothetical protein
LKRLILCECGEFIEGHTFKDYIETSANPSTPTIGHHNCGLIFNFMDGKLPKRYSSRIELKGIAMNFATKKEMDAVTLGRFLLEVDRLKSSGNLCDADILFKAYENLNFGHGDLCCTDAVPSPGEELEAARAAIERAPVPSRAKTGRRAESRKKR